MRILINLFLISFLSCSSGKETTQDNDSIKIQEIYYQKWVAGIQGGGSGINVHLTLEEGLNEEITLDKLQIKDVETTTIQKTDDLHYVASLKTKLNQLTLDENPINEYGNEVPQEKEIRLKEGQVKLFFTIGTKQFYKIIENVKEKPMIAYPSMNKSKN
ncbi:hypothetical protein SY27_10670 [Flavobacterium sp. 316]|uniref:hypothetical protein n=1 Tax=Flavobacterium sp. 316 TaxID=1603293 RepID=UPI0005DF1031|nr:hypothetical protein [Flavobacterium sp. 316]KIX21211.1 hypothetical protein SY27_10670 [Flavobacterium sp. 316]